VRGSKSTGLLARGLACAAADLGSSVRPSSAARCHVRRNSAHERRSRSPAAPDPASGRGSTLSARVDAMAAARNRDRGAGVAVLSLPAALQERPVGPLRAQRRRPGPAHRAQPLPRPGPRPRGRGQLAAASQRPRSPAAAAVVDRPRLQALRIARVGRTSPPGSLGSRGGARDVRLRRAPLRPAGRGVRGRRLVDDAPILRAGPLDARGGMRDGRSRVGLRGPGRRCVRSRRAGAHADRQAVALAGDGGGGPVRWFREPRGFARARRAAAGRGSRVGHRTGVVVAGRPLDRCRGGRRRRDQLDWRRARSRLTRRRT
jgi:hypothetical protein